jgi:hypothetical protein
MTTGNLGKLAALASSLKLLAVSHKLGEEKSGGKLRKLSEKIGAAPGEAPRTTVLAGEYKFGPLPNNYCVLQDVAEWSRNQPAMNSSEHGAQPFDCEELAQGGDPYRIATTA